MEIEEVDGFEKNENFSPYWDVMTKDPIQATFWGIDPNGGVHSMMHEEDARSCAEQTGLLVFRADLSVPEEETS